ncbi:MAG: stage III sporulation protein AC [Oscillospiraceae bacterium]|nr:stage III sporulation protein AC [Oscillospiraceae bacterium]
MELDLIFKIAAVGIIVAVLNLILKKTDHDEQAMMMTVAGLVIVLMMLIPAIDELFNTIRSVFGLW